MELEQRLCACGCGQKFKTMPSSSLKYASNACAVLAGAEPQIESRGERKPPTRVLTPAQVTLATPAVAPTVTVKEEPKKEEVGGTDEMAKQQEIPKGWVNVKTLAAELGVTTATIYNRENKGTLRSKQIDGAMYFDLAKAKADFAKERQEPKPKRARASAAAAPVEDDDLDAICRRIQQETARRYVAAASQARDSNRHDLERECLWRAVQHAGLSEPDAIQEA